MVAARHRWPKSLSVAAAAGVPRVTDVPGPGLCLVTGWSCFLPSPVRKEVFAVRGRGAVVGVTEVGGVPLVGAGDQAGRRERVALRGRVGTVPGDSHCLDVDRVV